MKPGALSRHAAWSAALTILVADAGAQCNEQILVPSNPQPGTGLGASLSLVGDVLIVGDTDFGAAGRAFAFERVGGSVWSGLQILLPQDPSVGDEFGQSVATNGSVTMVGAYRDDDLGMNSGSVHVFNAEGFGWTHVQKLVASGGLTNDQFGQSVSISGDVAVIGATGDDQIASGAGAAYVFEQQLSGWTQTQKLVASNGASNGSFGWSVSISGDTILIGAPFAGGVATNSGLAYIFERGPTAWGETQILQPLDAAGSMTFGLAVALDGTTAVIGANNADDACGGSPGCNSGAAYVFELNGTTWTQTTELLAPDTEEGDKFGESVAIAGDRIAIGAPDDDNVIVRAGSVYVYERSGTDWSLERQLIPSNGETLADYGIAVAVGPTTVAVGAPNAGQLQPGAAYAYEGDFSAEPFTFCHGDGGDQVGCTPCPCGNDATAGSLGGCTNAAGTTGRLWALGCTGLLQDELRLRVSGTTPSTFALLVSADVQLPQSGPCPPGSGLSQVYFDGLRCVGGNLVRQGVRATDANGNSVAAWSPASVLAAQFGVGPGSTRVFQVIYRDDPLTGCGTGQNTTNGVSVTFTP